MSVTTVVKNGKSCWQVQVIRGGKRTRRFLDRKTSLRRDALALERELRAGLDAAEEGGEDQEEREMGPAPAWAGPGGVRASESPWTSVGASPGASVPSAARARANASNWLSSPGRPCSERSPVTATRSGLSPSCSSS